MATTRFVIDGSNLAHSGQRVAKLLRLLAVQEELKAHWPDAQVITICDPNLKRALMSSEHSAFDAMRQEGQLLTVPSRQPADKFILDYAKIKKAIVVSNDQYAEWGSRQRDIPLLSCIIVDDPRDSTEFPQVIFNDHLVVLGTTSKRRLPAFAIPIRNSVKLQPSAEVNAMVVASDKPKDAAGRRLDETATKVAYPEDAARHEFDIEKQEAPEAMRRGGTPVSVLTDGARVTGQPDGALEGDVRSAIIEVLEDLGGDAVMGQVITACRERYPDFDAWFEQIRPSRKGGPYINYFRLQSATFVAYQSDTGKWRLRLVSRTKGHRREPPAMMESPLQPTEEHRSQDTGDTVRKYAREMLAGGHAVPVKRLHSDLRAKFPDYNSALKKAEVGNRKPETVLRLWYVLRRDPLIRVYNKGKDKTKLYYAQLRPASPRILSDTEVSAIIQGILNDSSGSVPLSHIGVVLKAALRERGLGDDLAPFIGPGVSLLDFVNRLGIRITTEGRRVVLHVDPAPARSMETSRRSSR
jgi:hypothetical protein